MIKLFVIILLCGAVLLFATSYLAATIAQFASQVPAGLAGVL